MYLPNIFEERYVKKYSIVQVMMANSTNRLDKLNPFIERLLTIFAPPQRLPTYSNTSCKECLKLTLGGTFFL